MATILATVALVFALLCVAAWAGSKRNPHSGGWSRVTDADYKWYHKPPQYRPGSVWGYECRHILRPPVSDQEGEA